MKQFAQTHSKDLHQPERADTCGRLIYGKWRITFWGSCRLGPGIGVAPSSACEGNSFMTFSIIIGGNAWAAHPHM
jgi:hypothetical protein